MLPLTISLLPRDTLHSSSITNSMMASVESSTIEQFRQAILDDGFCHLADPNIGERVNQIAAKGFPFKTEEGLAFFKLSTFDEKASNMFSST